MTTSNRYPVFYDYYRTHALRLGLGILLFGAAFFLTTPVYPIQSVGSFMIDALGNQVVTLWILPVVLTLVSYDLMAPGISAYRVLVLPRAASYAQFVRPYLVIAGCNSLAVIGLAAVGSLLAGLIRGYAWSSPAVYPLAALAGVPVIVERLVMIGCFVWWFESVTLLASLITRRVLGAFLTDIGLGAIPLIIFKLPLTLLHRYPLYPGASLFWGNYGLAAQPVLIDFVCLTWVAVTSGVLWFVCNHARRQY